MNVNCDYKNAPATVFRKIIFLLIAVLFIQPLMAGGTQEAYKEYKTALFDRYNYLILEVVNGNIRAGEAKGKLAEIRNSFDQEYNDDAGIMEAHIDAVSEKRMPAGDALFYATLMRKNKYLEYRRAENRIRENANFNESLEIFDDLIDLLGSGDLVISELRDSLNNFKELSKVENNDLYIYLLGLLDSLENGGISIKDLKEQTLLWQENNTEKNQFEKQEEEEKNPAEKEKGNNAPPQGGNGDRGRN
jgi:hypothetical protein